MLIGAYEGEVLRFEVVESAGGFLVRSRDVATGAVEGMDAIVFRTATVAFRFAELAAAVDRLNEAQESGADVEAALAELAHQQALYRATSHALNDAGEAASARISWEREEESRRRRRLH